MDEAWGREFRGRMHRFAQQRRREGKAGIPVSIKVRVASGCFHREHSPHAYRLIEQHLFKSAAPSELDYLEHESGPELLVYLAVATAGISLLKSVVDLITTIIKARSEGVKKGDKPAEPLELIVRRVDDERKFKEELVLRIGHSEPVDEEVIERRLNDALQSLVKEPRDSDG